MSDDVWPPFLNVSLLCLVFLEVNYLSPRQHCFPKAQIKLNKKKKIICNDYSMLIMTLFSKVGVYLFFYPILKL